MIMDNKNYYDLLNVRPNASCREIHASYIRLLEEYKTDLNKTEEEDYFLKMAAKMNIAELEKAYAILSDAPIMPLRPHPIRSRSGWSRDGAAKRATSC